MNYVVHTFFTAIFAAGASLDGQTNVPLGAVLGCAGTVFLVGMWVSSKVTRFEAVCSRFEEQQQENIRRLDSLDDRLMGLDEKLANQYSILNERVWKLERN